MVKTNLDLNAGSQGTSFDKINNEIQDEKFKEMERLSKSTGSGHSTTDTISSAATTKSQNSNYCTEENPEKRKKKNESCCPAQGRLSNWFTGISGVGKFFFVLGSILTAGLVYLITLGAFAVRSDETAQ